MGIKSAQKSGKGLERGSQEWRRVGMQLSFALYSAANRFIRLHRPFLEPFGLTYPQFLVMLALYESEPRTVGSLGNELGMDNGTLTPLLKRLVAAGLVTRTRDERDERRVQIALTEAGKALRAQLCAVPERIETACKLTDDGLVELRDTLNGLGIARSAKAEEAPTDRRQGASAVPAALLGSTKPSGEIKK
jgi:MarR family transcriptional regulator, organic hydroperoxide resistance regulator